MKRPIITTLQVILIWISSIPILPMCYVIAWLDRKLKFRLSFPRDVAELAKSENWCLQTLRKNGILPMDAVVNEYKVSPLNPDTIFRSSAGIIEINYSDSGLPKTLKCFAKFAPTMGSVWNKTIFNIQLNHLKESVFNQYFVNNEPTVPSPRVYCSMLSFSTGNLCLITEFMEGCKEYSAVHERLPDEHLELVIEGMASLHARFWTTAPWANETVERMKKILGITDSTVYLFESLVIFRWSVAAKKILVTSWSRMNVPETLLHGDARVGNMMFPSAPGRGRFVFFDWQAVRKGKGAFDLAYFLVLSLPAVQRRRSENQAIDSYYKHIVTKGIANYSKEQLEEDYQDACLCVLVLLALPMLSGEVSADGVAAQIFVYGMDIWRERMQEKFNEFDYARMAGSYGISQPEAQAAVAEMLRVIEHRLKGICEGLGSTEVLDALQKNYQEIMAKI